MDKTYHVYKVNSEHAQACSQKHLVVLEQLMVDADGICAAAHAVVQLRLQGETRDGSLVCMLLHRCKGFLKLLKAEQAVCLQTGPSSVQDIMSFTCTRQAYQQ